MSGTTTRTFKSGNSEAIRIPKELAFGEGVEVELHRSGDVLTVIRKPQQSLKKMIEALRNLPDVPEVEIRDPDIFPDRGDG